MKNLMMCMVLIVVLAILASPAFAIAGGTQTNWWEETNPFDGWTVSQIMAHPGFHAFLASDPVSRDTICPSQARVSAAPSAPYAYKWIGYIELSREPASRPRVVVFDASGVGVTMISPEFCPQPWEWIPMWVSNAIDYLYQRGYYEGYY